MCSTLNAETGVFVDEKEQVAAMTRKLRWHELITLNLFWFGANLATGTLTPLLLPYLVALFVPDEQKNTYFS